MRKSFKEFLKTKLLENVDIKKLIDSEAFKKIKMIDEQFAHKLATAWEGDVRDYVKNNNFEPLVPKMLTKENIKKLAPTLNVTPELENAFKEIIELHMKSFPKKSSLQKYSNDIWGHVPFNRSDVKDIEFDLK